MFITQVFQFMRSQINDQQASAGTQNTRRLTDRQFRLIEEMQDLVNDHQIEILTFQRQVQLPVSGEIPAFTFTPEDDGIYWITLRVGDGNSVVLGHVHLSLTRHLVHRKIISEVGRLIPYVRNARTHSAHQVAQIAASIAEAGATS